jgi:hypothetical protein
MKVAKFLFHVVLSLCVATPAFAQESGGVGGPTGAPAAAGTAPAQGPGQAPAIVIPPTQTPTIKNAPARPGQTTPQEAVREEQKRRQRLPESGDAPTTAQNEFQEFIAVSTGQRLPLFGYNLFAGVPTTFAPVENIPVTGEYVIGPGDELLIRAWGQVEINGRAVVDRNGTIYLPKVGTLTVAGQRYDTSMTTCRLPSEVCSRISSSA